LLSYGVSEASPRPAATTQARLLRLELLVESMWPDFNRYHGAESIGAASDLYVLRPLSRARPFSMGDNARVYSQGVNAKEARGGLDHDRAEAVLRRVGEDLEECATGDRESVVEGEGAEGRGRGMCARRGSVERQQIGGGHRTTP